MQQNPHLIPFFAQWHSTLKNSILLTACFVCNRILLQAALATFFSGSWLDNDSDIAAIQNFFSFMICTLLSMWVERNKFTLQLSLQSIPKSTSVDADERYSSVTSLYGASRLKSSCGVLTEISCLRAVTWKYVL
jgi:hypothetical protein